MKKSSREQEKAGRQRRLVLSRETIKALDEPALLGLVRGGTAMGVSFSGTGPTATVDSNS